LLIELNRARASERNKRRPTILGDSYIQLNGMEQMGLPPEWQQLAQENGSLRTIIVELLIKNQNLRWQLLGHAYRPVQDPRALMASEGTP
jgi:hypothetical protein